MYITSISQKLETRFFFFFFKYKKRTQIFCWITMYHVFDLWYLLYFSPILLVFFPVLHIKYSAFRKLENLALGHTDGTQNNWNLGPSWD